MSKQKGKRLTGIWRHSHSACDSVMNVLGRENKPSQNFLVARAEYAGPAYQYSHGLSVYFPWSKPTADYPIMLEYESYEFTETLWFCFLKKYFDRTMRYTRRMEADPKWPLPTQKEIDRLRED